MRQILVGLSQIWCEARIYTCAGSKSRLNYFEHEENRDNTDRMVRKYPH
jgi:hypothetical protein